MDIINLKIKKLRPDAILPTKKPEDVGYDLYASTIERLDNGVVKISTGIAVELPNGLWGKLESRSSMAAKGFGILGGVIDNGYRGPIICLFNYTGDSNHMLPISIGDKVAQLILHEQWHFPIEEVEQLSETERGDKGFGSTGK